MTFKEWTFISPGGLSNQIDRFPYSEMAKGKMPVISKNLEPTLLHCLARLCPSAKGSSWKKLDRGYFFPKPNNLYTRLKIISKTIARDLVRVNLTQWFTEQSHDLITNNECRWIKQHTSRVKALIHPCRIIYLYSSVQTNGHFSGPPVCLAKSNMLALLWGFL